MAEAPTLSSVIETIRPLQSYGAAIHWLYPFDFVDDEGNKRGKTPRSKKWSTDAVLTLPALRSAYRARSNVGVRLGLPSRIGDYYLHVIDLDIRKPETKDAAWTALLDLLPTARQFPMVISGSGGESRHIYFLSDKPFQKRKLAKSKTHYVVFDPLRAKNVTHNDWEIDLMGTGSQAAIPPSLHPDTHLPYRWSKAPDFSLIEFGIGPIVASEQIKTWGARSLSDAENAEIMPPLGLTEAEIDTILRNIPNNQVEIVDGKPQQVGAHYDDYIEVGMALHHEYGGDEHGFQKWIEWGRQSTKFEEKHARYRWDKSFGGRGNPVRMATLIQKANALRFADLHNFEVEDDDFDDLDPPAPAAGYDLSEFFAPVPAKPATESLLDLATSKDDSPDLATDWRLLLHRNEEGVLKSTSHNIRVILSNDPRIKGLFGFNEFSLEEVLLRDPVKIKKARQKSKPIINLIGKIWEGVDTESGRALTDTHVAELRIMLEAPETQGGYAIKISDRDMSAAISSVAQNASFHPIKKKIEAAGDWDGFPRAERVFIDYLGAEDTLYHREASMKFLVAAVARIYEPGHPFDAVPILEGAQGIRKSTFIRTLSFGWPGELEGDLGDRQVMVEKMMGAWIVEIPELQGFSKADVNDIKGLISAPFDRYRPPYARRPIKVMRQCVMMGSTNDGVYLRDPTGSRRFWPIVCDPANGLIDIRRLEFEVPQLWAEARHRYLELRRLHDGMYLPLQLSEEASAEASQMQSSKTMETSEQALAGQITVWLDTPIDDTGFDDLDDGAPKVYRNETCIAQIWCEMLHRQLPIPHNEAMKIGVSLSQIGWSRSAGPITSRNINLKYGKTRVYYRE